MLSRLWATAIVIRMVHSQDRADPDHFSYCVRQSSQRNSHAAQHQWSAPSNGADMLNLAIANGVTIDAYAVAPYIDPR